MAGFALELVFQWLLSLGRFGFGLLLFVELFVHAGRLRLGRGVLGGLLLEVHEELTHLPSEWDRQGRLVARKFFKLLENSQHVE